MELRFKCPKCGQNELEMIAVNCAASFTVHSLDSETKKANLSFDNLLESGDIDHFGCSHCDHTLRHKRTGKLVQSEEGLVLWMKENWDKGSCALEPNQEYMTATVQFNIPLEQFKPVREAENPNTSSYAARISDMLNETFKNQIFGAGNKAWFHDYAFEVHQVVKETGDFPHKGMFFE